MRWGLLAGVVAACGGHGPRPGPPPRAVPSAAAVADPEAWRAAVPEPGPAGTLAYPTPSVERSKSGLQVYFAPRAGGTVSLMFVARAGQSDVPPGKSGLAALTARMMSEATRQRDAQGLAEHVEALGTTLWSDVGRDYLSLGLTVLSADVGAGLSVLGEAVRQPRFDAKDYARVQGEWLDGLASERQEPARLASLVGLRAVLGPHLGAPVAGSIADVKRLTVKDLAAFHRAHVVAEDSAVIVVGDVEEASVRALVATAFAGFSGKPWTRPAPPPLPRTDARRWLWVERPGSTQTALFAVQLFPKRGEAGDDARDVWSNVAGGLFTSRLNHNLREEHAYTYGVRSGVVAARDFGLFTVATRVRADATSAALREIDGELAALRGPRPVSPSELTRARADLVQSLGTHLLSAASIADDFSELFVYGLPADHLATFRSRVEGVAPADLVTEAARVDTSRFVVVGVGDATAAGELSPRPETAPQAWTE